MDPWANAQIRLAERQGLLVGTGLSMVQSGAVYLRLLQESRDKSEARWLTIKSALLATGKLTFNELFPGEVPAPAEEDGGEFLADDENPTAYRFVEPPSENWGPEEADRLLDELLGTGGKTSMTVSGRKIRDWDR